MPNYFSDNQDLTFQFDRLELREAVEILENGYGDAKVYDDAPSNYEEAMELYKGALELVGELAADFIAPRATQVDLEGAAHNGGKVSLAPGTREAIEQLAQLDLMGVIIPRKFGGINFPATIYMMMIEMISRADAALMTLFGYQDVGEAIAKLAPEEVAESFLRKYTSGEHTGAMVLTEPSAGSDLQAVKLQAFQDEEGQWRLRGVKHFISNGCGDVLLILARSEPNTNNIFGLSLFACHGGEKVKVTRIEEKMGMHGSPTCELYFDDAPAELVGRRRFGLIHVINILNHARFSVAAQGLGIAEAAYEEALKFARERVQFGKVIYTMPPIANMLMDMRVNIESSRTLLYAAVQWLEIRNKLEEHIEELKHEKQPFKEVKTRFDKAAAIVDLLSPLVKYVVTEMANQACYDAVQIHGGMGYMRGMTVERLYRDVRITSIYEGTTQVQVGGSVKGVYNDALADFITEKEAKTYGGELGQLAEKLKVVRELQLKSTAYLKGHEDAMLREAAAKELTDMYCHLYVGYLLLDEAELIERKALIAKRYVCKAEANAHRSWEAIINNSYADVDQADLVCDTAAAAVPI